MSLIFMASRAVVPAAAPEPDDLFFDDLSTGATKTMNGVTWGTHSGQADIISGFSIYGDSGFCIRNELPFPGNNLIGFDLGGVGYQELWLMWLIYMPTGAESPPRGPIMRGAINGNKLIRVEMYNPPPFNNPYPRYGASMYDGPGTDVTLGPQAGVFPGSGTVSQIPNDIGADELPFCNAANRGRWIALEWHGRNSTSSGSPNGFQEILLDGTLIAQRSGIDSFESGNDGFQEGYVWGSTDTAWETNPGTYVYVGYFAVNDTGRCTNPLA